MAKTALITGASGGIGYEISRCFAKDGYNIVMNGFNGEKLQEKGDALEKEFGITTYHIPQDLSAPGAADELIKSFDDLEIQIDALVNDAGFGVAGEFISSDWKKQHALMQVNMEVLTKLTYEFGARMAARKEGAILNVASMAAFMPGPYMATYYASKAYVRSLTDAIHKELEPYNVHVTALCPGPVRTKFFDRAGFTDTSVISKVSLTPDVVAQAAYRGLQRNQIEVIPGAIIKVVVALSKIAPVCLTNEVVTWLQKNQAANL